MPIIGRPMERCEDEDQPGPEKTERRRNRYFGLRPRRALRRKLIVGLAVLLFGAIVAEAVWLARHAPT